MKSFKNYFAFLLIVLTCIAFFIAIWVYFNINQIGNFFFKQQSDYIMAMNQHAATIVAELKTDSTVTGKQVKNHDALLVTEPFYIYKNKIYIEKDNNLYHYVGKQEDKIRYLYKIRALMRNSIDINRFDLIKIVFILIILILFGLAFVIYRSFMKDIQKDINLVIREINEESSIQDIQINEFSTIVKGLKKYREISKQIDRQNAVMDLMEQWKFESRKIVHDLKNPLQRLSLALNEIQEKEKLKSAQKALDEMNSYINRLKISGDSDEKVEKQIDLNDFFKKISVLFDEIKINYNSDISLFSFDEFAFQRLCSNLTQNAIDASAKNISFNFSYIENKEILDIINDGDMISDREKLFVPYSTTKVTGNGLGLLIITQIVHKHKGKFYLLKSDEKETIFRMERDII